MADPARHLDADRRPRLSRLPADRQHDRRRRGGRRGRHPIGDPLAGRGRSRRPAAAAADPAGHPIAARPERRVARDPGGDQSRELRCDPRGGDRVRRHRRRRPADAPGAGRRPGRPPPRRQRGRPRRRGDERDPDRRSVGGGAPHRPRGSGRLLRIPRGRLSGTDRRAADGDPRRRTAAETGRRDRLGRARRRPPASPAPIRSSAAW